MVQENISLLKNEEREVIQGILNSKKIPIKITNELLRIFGELFSGFEKVEVSKSSLIKDLTCGGMPCTIEEYEKRFESHLKELIHGRNQLKIRIVIEE